MKTPNQQISEKIDAGEYENKIEQLREDLEFAFGTCCRKVTLRNLLWNKAWEHGHSNGLNAVRYWYNEFVQFTK